MRKPDLKKNDTAGLYNVLVSHLRTLIAARADERLISEFTDLLKDLKSKPFSSDENFRSAKDRNLLAKHSVNHQLLDKPLDLLAELIHDPSVSRKELEHLAIKRFGIPRGSMRSFSNRQMLLAKLSSMIRNELAHQTIGRVARRRDVYIR